MTKFWIAAAMGAPIYFVEELLVYWRQRVQPIIRNFPVFFPVIREFGAETGSP
jgi:type IV secretory pathway TrbD component